MKEATLRTDLAETCRMASESVKTGMADGLAAGRKQAFDAAIEVARESMAVVLREQRPVIQSLIKGTVTCAIAAEIRQVSAATSEALKKNDCEPTTMPRIGVLEDDPVIQALLKGVKE